MLGGMVWVGMSRSRFVGGRNVKAPVVCFPGKLGFCRLCARNFITLSGNL